MGDWLTIIIVLLILGILLDGWRRMRNAQRDSLKVSRSMRKSASLSTSEREDYNSAELPNGGARVVAYRDSGDPEPRASAVRTRSRHAASETHLVSEQLVPGQSVSKESVSEHPLSEHTGWEEADEGPEYEERAFLEEPELEEPELAEAEFDAPELSADQLEEAQVDAAHSAVPHRSPPVEQSADLSSSHRASPSLEAEGVGESESEWTQEHEPVAEVPEYAELELEPEAKPKPRAAADTRGRIPQQVALNLDESVPILMETTENDDDQSESDDSHRIEPTFGGARKAPATQERAPAAKHRASAPQNKPSTEPTSQPRAKSKPSFGSALGASLSSKAMQAKEAFSAKLASSGLMNSTHSQEEAEPVSEQTPLRNAPEPEAPATTQAPRKRTAAKTPPPSPTPPQPEEVLIVNIMAPQGQQFRGGPLLDALIHAGLRFGDMNIFHRYQESHGGGPILFSLANMVKPGIFDLDAMDEFNTPGVSLFMTLPLDNARQGNVEVFELMLDSARSIADDLGGELKDENRSVMTRQTMEHCRQRIHEFERKQLSRAPS